MHIAMISAEYPPRWGGMGSTVHHLTAHLKSKGHKVSIITRRNSKKLVHNTTSSEIHEVKWAKVPMHFTRSFGRNAVKKLETVHRINPVDIVHIHLPMVSLTKKELSRCKKIGPLVASLHGSWRGERDGLMIARKMREPAVFRNPNDLAILLTANHYSRYEKLAATMANVSISNSDATYRDFINRYEMMDEWDCRTIHWGVDTELFRPMDPHNKSDIADRISIRERYGIEENDLVLLAVGRLAARKGYSTLLRSFKKIQEEVSNSKLLIVGRGGMKSFMIKQAKKYGISENMTIESSLDFEDLSRVYRASDLSVFPSYYEGQGLIPLEAMSSGIPIIGTDDGPIPEMVDDHVGGLFELGNHENLADAIIGHLTNIPSLKEKGKAGRDRVLENFTFEQTCEKFEVVYADLIVNSTDQS